MFSYCISEERVVYVIVEMVYVVLTGSIWFWPLQNKWGYDGTSSAKQKERKAIVLFQQYNRIHREGTSGRWPVSGRLKVKKRSLNDV